MKELTDRFIAGLKGTGARQEIKDGKWPLRLVVNPAGTEKSFQVRWKSGGSSHRRVIGHYPSMKLGQARDHALAIKAGLKNGITPVASRVAGIKLLAANGITVSQAFAAYMESEGERRARPQARWNSFALDVEPIIGSAIITKLEFGDFEHRVIAGRLVIRLLIHEERLSTDQAVIFERSGT